MIRGMSKPRILLLVLVAGVLSAALLEAQRGGRGGRSRFEDNSFRAITDKEDPTTEFAIARWYSRGWIGNGWNHDYPTAEEHILQIIKNVTAVETDVLSYKIVDISTPEIFKYPFAYVSHPGEVDPSDEEIENIREYIERGGFLMLDDFGGQGQGPWEMEGWLTLLRRAFPGREMYKLKDNHELLRLFYDIDNLEMEHPMAPESKAVFYGFDDEKGRLAMVICYSNDVGDYWEFLDQPRYKLKPSAEAVKLGVNFAIYSMTH
jgi:hypothetical protein